jgi:hypothetical protein
MAPSTNFPSLAAACIAACLLMNSATPAGAQVAQEPKPGKPVYNPHTKSWFELRVDLPTPSNWRSAVKFARKKTFKGVRGRLAMVKDLETHSFLRANFDALGATLIGLRYFCSFRKLVWIDGTEQTRKQFKMWNKKWYRTEIRCGKQRIQYMPVYYRPTQSGFRWQASGPEKYFVSYFVEYPTGAEDPKDAPKPDKKPAADAAQESDKSATAKPAPEAPTAEAKPSEAKPAKE